MGYWTCSVYGSCSGQTAPCPTNLTAWSPATLTATNIRSNVFYKQIRDAINRERSRRSEGTKSFQADLATNAIDAFKYVLELKDAIDDTARSNPARTVTYNTLGYVCTYNTSYPSQSSTTTSAPAWTNSYINSTSVTSVRAHLAELRSKINTLEGQCMCNCNYCTCNCNYCTCNCNYCTCVCYYCVCTCNY